MSAVTSVHGSHTYHSLFAQPRSSLPPHSSPSTCDTCLPPLKLAESAFPSSASRSGRSQGDTAALPSAARTSLEIGRHRECTCCMRCMLYTSLVILRCSPSQTHTQVLLGLVHLLLRDSKFFALGDVQTSLVVYMRDYSCALRSLSLSYMFQENLDLLQLLRPASGPCTRPAHWLVRTASARASAWSPILL